MPNARLVALAAFTFVAGGCSSLNPVATEAPSPSAASAPTAFPISSAALETYTAPTGFWFEHPADWKTVDIAFVIQLGGGQLDALITNYPIVGCGSPAAEQCALSAPVPPGGVHIDVGGSGNNESIFDPMWPWNETIDGMPAYRLSTPGYTGVDSLRTWVVAVPGSINRVVGLSAALRGPGLAELEAKLDAMARSIRFATHPPPLDPARAADALRAGLDFVDADAQTNNDTKFYSCFPRRPGSRHVTLDRFWGAVLDPPVPVVCTSAIEPTTVNLWRIMLSVEWDAGANHAAGTWREELYFDAKGVRIGDVQLTPSVAPVHGFDPTPAPAPSSSG